MAVALLHTGGGQIAVSATSLRGDDATEALADFLMTDPGARTTASTPGLVAVVVRRGIDVIPTGRAVRPCDAAGAPEGLRTLRLGWWVLETVPGAVEETDVEVARLRARGLQVTLDENGDLVPLDGHKAA
ncbi:hypothetical protein [Streptomyces yaizuensis]|uniref:Uncharacterized protein n=1 Tax=Streptomyces yaizuensis TaxID=2989713 RepID=A0ABQ5PBB5_9ACTN|nr:hypothetical protein [Streptomyces sp. YSPA8]GLF99857.1 hypothetical protein SYYSPA8_36190 [Streptomyces sp. YSPA8]